MIPKVAASGRSFKGAAQYYLHDKSADTSERVAFTEAVNLMANDPRTAIAHMIDTATHADELKHAAGIKAGRKLQKPVYSYSLAWHPSETPTKAEQIEAARDTLKLLGLSKHQALIVAHTDKDHQHVHVIVNRVHPETGKAASMSNDRRKLSEWAQGYEEQRGQVFCIERVKNNAERQQGRFVKDQSPTRQQYYEWKKAETGALWKEYRAERDKAKDDLRGQLDALWQQRSERIAMCRAEIKGQFKPHWRDLFRQQGEEARAFDNSLTERLKLAVAHSRKDKTVRQKGSYITGVFRALMNDPALRVQLTKRHEAERKRLATQQKGYTRETIAEVDKAHKYDRQQLLEAHRAQSAERQNYYRDTTGAIWNSEGQRVQETPKQKPSPEQSRAPTAQGDAKKDFADAAQKANQRTEFNTRADPAKKATPQADKAEQPPEREESAIKARQREKRERTKGRTRSRQR